MTKQMGTPEDEERQIDTISFILVVLAVAVLPLVYFPRIVNTPVITTYFMDTTGYYKTVFLIFIAMFMVTLMGFKTIARKQKIKISLPHVLFLIWIVVSFFFAEDYGVAFHGYPLRWQGTLAYFCYAVFFVFVTNMIKPRYIKRVIVAGFVGVCICAIHSILNFYGCEPLDAVLAYAYNREIPFNQTLRGTLGNRNTAGAFFSIPTIASMVLFLKSDGKKKILYYIVFVLSYMGLLASLTRVAWLGAIGAIILTAWFFRKEFKRYLKRIIVVLITFVLVLAVMDVTGGAQIVGRYVDMTNSIESLSEGNVDQFGSYRGYIYKRAIQVIANNPIVGVGIDCFAYYTILSRKDYEENPGLSGIGYFDKAHSEYLEYAATMGIPALVFYLWFLLSIFVPWFKRRKEMSPEMLAIFLGVSAYLMQACFNFGTTTTMTTLFVMLGLLKNGLNKEEEAICIEKAEEEIVASEETLINE